MEHTNEVLMSMGDDWFVERTTARALETVKERQTIVQDTLNLLQKEVDTLIQTIDTAKEEARHGNSMKLDKDGFMEIQEHYNENKNEVPRPPPMVTGTSSSSSSTHKNKPSSANFDELARLEALEEEEGLSDEPDGDEDESSSDDDNDEDLGIVLGKGTKNQNYVSTTPATSAPSSPVPSDISKPPTITPDRMINTRTSSVAEKSKCPISDVIERKPEPMEPRQASETAPKISKFKAARMAQRGENA